MKRVFEYSFLLFISLISFYITHKTVLLIKQNDSIMTYLNKIDDDYIIYPIEPIIKDNTIIPGLNGKKINKDKSYNNIKRVGSFNDKLLVYSNIDNKNKLRDNLDKYIIKGNKYKKMVSILLYIDDYTDIDYLNSLNIPFDYIVNDHDIKSLKHNYCFNKDLDDEFLKECYKKGYYSIYSDVITTNYLYNVKRNIESGSFIVLKGKYEKEIILIINYIYSKGYEIVDLDNHLNEDI